MWEVKRVLYTDNFAVGSKLTPKKMPNFTKYAI
jgi:hypothetical protein